MGMIAQALACYLRVPGIVLLLDDVRLTQVINLGLPALGVVLVLMFLVIAVTVVFAGLTGGLMAAVLWH
jgi:hypothetical protein